MEEPWTRKITGRLSAERGGPKRRRYNASCTGPPADCFVAVYAPLQSSVGVGLSAKPRDDANAVAAATAPVGAMRVRREHGPKDSPVVGFSCASDVRLISTVLPRSMRALARVHHSVS